MAGGRRRHLGGIRQTLGPQWSPGLMAGGRAPLHGRGPTRLTAAMEPRPDGRGKPAALRAALDLRGTPQWSPGLMAGGSGADVRRYDDRRSAAMEPRPDGRGKLACGAEIKSIKSQPQWSPGLMAGGSGHVKRWAAGLTLPQWSPGLMAGGSSEFDRHRLTAGSAAMEPRPDGRGKSSGGQRVRSRQYCRNGAPA